MTTVNQSSPPPSSTLLGQAPRRRRIQLLQLGHDALRCGGPDERLGVGIVLGEVAVDGRLPVDQRMEGAAAQPAAGHGRKEGFDGVEPGTGGGRVVEGPALVPLQPGADLGMLVGGPDRLHRVSVEHDVNQLAGRDRRLDRIEEAEKLLVPVAGHAAAEHRAVQDVERREQGGRPVPNIVMGHGTGLAGLERQPRPSAALRLPLRCRRIIRLRRMMGAVECLDLGLFVDGEHDGMRRRVDVQPDDGAHLLGELRVVGELEGSHPVRLQTVRTPDPLHRAGADADRRRDGRGGPVRRLARRLAGRGQRHHPGRDLGAQRRYARGAGLVPQQPFDPRHHEPLLPAPGRYLAHPGLSHDLHRAVTSSRQQHDPRPPDVLLRAVPIGHHRLETDSVGGTHFDDDPFAHPPKLRSGPTERTSNRTHPFDFFH